MPSVDPSFGKELRRQRNASGMSLAQLAAKVHCSKAYLSRVERGLRNPSDSLALLCDAKLGAGGQLVALRNRPVRQLEDLSALSAAEFGSPGPWSLQLRADGTSDFTAYGSAAPAEGDAPAVAAKWALAPGVQETGSANDTLTVFRAMLHQHRALGQCSSPAVVAPLSIAATAALRGLSRTVPSAQRAATLRLAARFAEYTGWMAQEAGDDQAARWWTGQATTLAEAGGDDEMAAYALVRQAELALYQGDSMSTVALATEAGARARDRRTKELAAQRQAQGYALLGRESECRRALERGAELASATRPQDHGTPVLGSTHLPDLSAFVTAWCLRELGEAEQAVALLDTGQDTMAPHAGRARARHGARLALALAEAGDIERACAVAALVAQDVITTDSATVRADLRQLRSSLAARRKHPVVRDILPVIAESLRGSPDLRAGAD
ncbi:helix-turn-helix transcriptional regulator [Streptomyces sp. NPDC005728]|uniref:helix-turn-helix transcriptional regulator n=1 Tax=Streptomyces sp. NPDC005728 TaxID=3157054 RepID=UPI0033F5676C